MNLNSLSLIDINVARNAWPYLFRNLEHCSDLIRLDLSRNELDGTSIHFLAKSLMIQKQVSKLSLASCDLDEDCMRELAKGLRHHRVLSSLDISQNIYW